jgi:uncharacterized protein (TIGR02117 family)
MFRAMKARILKALGVLKRTLGIFFELFFAFATLWWFTGTLLSVIPRKPSGVLAGDEKVTIYIVNNGIHTDVYVPQKSKWKDWGRELGISEQLEIDTARHFLAIGWGQEQFFMRTKNWSDLTVGTALITAFHLGTSAMHVVHKKAPEKESKDVAKLEISDRQYLKLCGYIEAGFSRKNGAVRPITDHPYGEHDFFFKADRSYGLAYTCNSWTNDALKAAGQRACVWTAFTDGVFRFLK